MEKQETHHLPHQNLRRVLCRQLLDRPLRARVPSRERPRRDVVLQDFLVDDVDDGGDELLDVFGAGEERVDVALGRRGVLVWWEGKEGNRGGRRGGRRNSRELKSRKECK
jgi:hypothetical protein